ncbi:MAG: hypothetical protein J0M17_06115 [Planctomycetes bacterium]|nr:hypothetical protein [Planctomycetota bacterium]
MFDGISRTLGEAARSLQRTDGTALFIAAAVAYYVGQALVREWPRHHAAGQKIGVCVFGGIFVLLFFHTTHDYLAAVIWAALWAVLITGIVWAAGPLLYGAGDLLVFRPLRAITRGVHAMHEHRVAERERRYAEETERLRHAQNQLRRTEARAACERLYCLHESIIASRFPRDRFTAFLDRYLGDDHAPEEVETQAEELKQLIEAHRLKADPPAKLASLGDIAAWFEEQKAQIEQVNDEQLRRTLLVQLKAKYAEAIARILEEAG